MTIAYTYMHDMNTGWWLMMVLGWLILLALAVWAIVSLVSRRRGDGSAESPREILDRRLAEGEISLEEHRRLVDATKQRGGSPAAS